MRKEKSEQWTEALSLAVGLWLCTVPLTFFLAAFFFDFGAASVSAAASFVAVLLLCMAICVRRWSVDDAAGGKMIRRE